MLLQPQIPQDFAATWIIADTMAGKQGHRFAGWSDAMLWMIRNAVNLPFPPQFA
jgi:hypothetical protein